MGILLCGTGMASLLRLGSALCDHILYHSTPFASTAPKIPGQETTNRLTPWHSRVCSRLVRRLRSRTTSIYHLTPPSLRVYYAKVATQQTTHRLTRVHSNPHFLAFSSVVQVWPRVLTSTRIGSAELGLTRAFTHVHYPLGLTPNCTSGCPEFNPHHCVSFRYGLAFAAGLETTLSDHIRATHAADIPKRNASLAVCLVEGEREN